MNEEKILVISNDLGKVWDTAEYLSKSCRVEACGCSVSSVQSSGVKGGPYKAIVYLMQDEMSILPEIEGDGVSFVTYLQQQRPATKIVVMTPQSDLKEYQSQNIPNAMFLSANDYAKLVQAIGEKEIGVKL